MERYSFEFQNIAHINMWRTSLFAPLLEGLHHNTYSSELGDEDVVKLVANVERLQDTYANKKEALVHADLHCNNILILNADSANREDERDSKKSEGFKGILTNVHMHTLCFF